MHSLPKNAKQKNHEPLDKSDHFRLTKNVRIFAISVKIYCNDKLSFYVSFGKSDKSGDSGI